MTTVKLLLQRYLKGVLERVFHSANIYFSQKQKQEKSFKTRWSRRERLAACLSQLEFDTLHDIVPFEVSLFSFGLTWHFGLLSRRCREVAGTSKTTPPCWLLLRREPAG